MRGDLAVDHMDEQIPWMNHVIWAEDINDSHARVLKARYYGEISYIDDCLGRILDAVEAAGMPSTPSSASSPTTAITWATITPGRRRASSRHRVTSPSW